VVLILSPQEGTQLDSELIAVAIVTGDSFGADFIRGSLNREVPMTWVVSIRACIMMEQSREQCRTVDAMFVADFGEGLSMGVPLSGDHANSALPPRPDHLAAAAEKPLNILFLFADDWGRYASIYAEHEKFPSPNQVVKTPNIDRIAREGALFPPGLCECAELHALPQLAPFGRYFFNTGRAAILNGAVWDPAIPSFPLLLKDQGYHIGKAFKVWSPGDPADAPFGGRPRLSEVRRALQQLLRERGQTRRGRHRARCGKAADLR
jgi:hypothetical protein